MIFHPSIKTLSLFMEGSLPENRLKKINRHLEKCRKCAGRIKTFHNIEMAVSSSGEKHSRIVNRVMKRLDDSAWTSSQICGEIKKISGSVRIRDITGNPRSAFPGMALKRGDSVESSSEDLAMLELEDGSVFCLNKNTKLVFPGGENDMRLEKGRIFAMMKPRRVSFRIKTPAALLSIVGTDFDVRVGRAGETLLKVYQGCVSFKNNSGGVMVDKGRYVKAGTMTKPFPFRFRESTNRSPWTYPLLGREKKKSATISFVPVIAAVVLIAAVFMLMNGSHRIYIPAADTESQVLKNAFGYATVCHYEKAEDLCDRVLQNNPSESAAARAHWIKAVAFARFQYEYRTGRLEKSLNEELNTVEKLHPQLLRDVLPAHIVCHDFFVEHNMDAEQFIADAKSKYSKKAGKEVIPAFKLGYSYWLAAEAVKDDSDKSAEYYEKARELLKRATEHYPESREYAAHYITLLIEMKRGSEAKLFSEILIHELDEQYESVPTSRRDPWSIYAETLSFSDPAKGAELELLHSSAVGLTNLKGGGNLIIQRTHLPSADAWTHYALTQYRALNFADTPEEKARLWEDLLVKYKKENIVFTGHNMRALAGAYYKIGKGNLECGENEKALSAFRKLRELSPHYADVHYRLGILWKSMAIKENDSSDKEKLLQKARKELTEQLKYNWRGEAATKAWNELNTREAEQITVR